MQPADTPAPEAPRPEDIDAVGDEADAVGDFFGGLDAGVLDFAAGAHHATALGEAELGVDGGKVLADHELDADLDGAVSALLMGAWIYGSGRSVRTRRIGLHASRSLLGTTAMACWFRSTTSRSAPPTIISVGAVTTTANLGITLDAWGPWSAAFRLRYFGPRPLLEDGSVQSASSLTGNLRVGYRVDARNRLSLDVFNVFNTRSNDIEYFYESRLKGESAPVWDRHVHPAEPRMLRLSWSHRFD